MWLLGKATKLLITGPIPNHDQSVSVTPPPLTFSLHHHQVSFLLAVWYRKAQNIFFSHTPWRYSIKYFRFPRKLILLSHLPLPNIKTPASPTLWLWELLGIFQLYFKVIFTQIDMSCLNIALKYTKKFTLSMFCISWMIYWFSISPLYWEFVFCFTFLNYINHSKFYYLDITNSMQHFERIKTLLTKVLIDK